LKGLAQNSNGCKIRIQIAEQAQREAPPKKRKTLGNLLSELNEKVLALTAVSWL